MFNAGDQALIFIAVCHYLFVLRYIGYFRFLTSLFFLHGNPVISCVFSKSIWIGLEKGK